MTALPAGDKKYKQNNYVNTRPIRHCRKRTKSHLHPSLLPRSDHTADFKFQLLLADICCSCCHVFQDIFNSFFFFKNVQKVRRKAQQIKEKRHKLVAFGSAAGFISDISFCSTFETLQSCLSGPLRDKYVCSSFSYCTAVVIPYTIVSTVLYYCQLFC